jgi:uncharacterized membrane protein YeaQ/YmgE (transglycosylase-associated protein family)
VYKMERRKQMRLAAVAILAHLPVLASRLLAAPAALPGVFLLQERAVYVGYDGRFLGRLLMGALAGWLSGELIRGKGFGCIGNTLLGLVGAVIGGWLFGQLHIGTYGFIGGLAAATVGAVVLVALARAISGGN